MIKQENILAIQDGKVIGFLSFINNHENKGKNYITTIVVDKDYRGQGIANQFYDFIETGLPKAVHSNYVYTRTWNTNFAHLKLLDKRGYTNTQTIKNDRTGPDGELLDTVYYGKKLN